MAEDVHVDIRQLEAFQKNLEDASRHIREIEAQCAKGAAGRMLRSAAALTPTKTGYLRRGWRIRVLRPANPAVVRVENPVKYASYVEYGHRQTPGRYVPAIGKRLVNGWVDGRLMLTKAAAQVEKDLPKIIDQEITNYLKTEVFK